MSNVKYRELFYKSQAAIADTIESLENLSEQLKKIMNECEDEIISDNNNININVKD